MSNATLRLTSLAALVLLAAGPATRPSGGQYVLRVCRYHGKVAVVTAEFSADLDRPFSNATHIGADTLTISGTVGPTGRRNDVGLRMSYEELDSDPKRPGYWKVSTRLEPDFGHEQNLSGGPGDTRIAVTVTERPQR